MPLLSPTVTRLGPGPIISAASHPSIGTNIQGPSLIEIPGWIPNRLGRFYLYFADHKGSYIRLAYADELAGPWTVHEPGSLHLTDSLFPTEALPITDEQFARFQARYEAALGGAVPYDLRGDLTVAHIASPDVHVDHDRGLIIMYFHGLEQLGQQMTRVATSTDGISFTALPDTIAHTYLRVFRHHDVEGGAWFGVAMPGHLYRSGDGLTDFRLGPRILDDDDMRHCALRLRDTTTLELWWTRVGDAPEQILLSTVDIAGPWSQWRATDPIPVLAPEMDWEGADLSPEPSRRGAAKGPVNQLRDPCIFETDGNISLLYAGAGESAIGIATVEFAKT